MLRWGLLLGVTLGAAYAMNIYLMLTVGAVRQSEKAIDWLWRMRVPLDLGIAAALLITSEMTR